MLFFFFFLLHPNCFIFITQVNLSGRPTLPALLRLTDQDCVKVLLQPCELQLALGDLIQSHPQQAVLVELAQVVDPWWPSVRVR